MLHRYIVLLELESDGSAYNVIVPALPEAHTWGNTVESALHNAREVIELCLDERRERGIEIPASAEGIVRMEIVSVA